MVNVSQVPAKMIGNTSQNFVSIVPFFSQSTGLVLRLQSFENKKRSEIKQVQ
jgi:hypothetical protein